MGKYKRSDITAWIVLVFFMQNLRDFVTYSICVNASSNAHVDISSKARSKFWSESSSKCALCVAVCASSEALVSSRIYTGQKF